MVAIAPGRVLQHTNLGVGSWLANPRLQRPERLLNSGHLALLRTLSFMPSFSDARIREIVHFSASAPIESVEAAQIVEDHFGVTLPATLKRIHQMGGGACILIHSSCKKYVSCDLHALAANPFEHYGKSILDAHQLILSGLNQCREVFRRVVPFGQDGGECEFCLDYRRQEDPQVAILAEGDYRLVARSFDEFMDRAFPDRLHFWQSPPNAISGDEHQQFLSDLPDYW